MTIAVDEISVPDSRIAREITELVRDTESPLLFHHSSRVYHWGALAGKRKGLRFDPELLYAGAMFHDMGLTHQHRSEHDRFEVDGANAARDFLRSRGVSQQDVDTVWTAIALHTTPGIPPHMHPVVALVTAGVEMDVLGFAYGDYTQAEREAVVRDDVALTGISAVALAHGLVIMAFAFAFVSGGHKHPAVSVGVFAAGAVRIWNPPKRIDNIAGRRPLRSRPHPSPNLQPRAFMD